MTNQRETNQTDLAYEETELRSAAERYQQPPRTNEKSPEAIRTFMIGEHIKLLRNDYIDKGNAA